MDELLKVSSTRRFTQQEDALVPAGQQRKETEDQPNTQIESADDTLHLLQSKPNLESLITALRWLSRSSNAKGGGFNIKVPSPKAAQVLNVLVNDILPDYWQILRPDDDDSHLKPRRLFIKCLTSIAGIGALTTRMRNLMAVGKANESSKLPKSKEHQTPLNDVFELLEHALSGPTVVLQIAKDIVENIEKPMQRALALKELVSWVASGRLISTSAEAETIGTGRPVEESSWLADGKAYSRWLGRNIMAFSGSNSSLTPELSKTRNQIFSRGLSLGYRDELVEAIYAPFLHGEADALDPSTRFFADLPPREQKIVLFALLRLVPSSSGQDEGNTTVRGISALLERVGAVVSLHDLLVDWIIEPNSGSVNLDLVVHRAVITVISRDAIVLEDLTKRLLASFSDKLNIAHQPILNQEMQTQDLLLAIGHLLLVDKSKLEKIARSSEYINAISNRLAASSSRAQFLGMVVGTTVSKVVDESDKRLNLGIEDLDSEDGKWYMGLVSVVDSLGTMQDIKQAWKSIPKPLKQPHSLPIHPKKSNLSKKSAQPQTSKIVAIEELEDSESDDDDLPLYQKPDSDQEDSDEDPTLITRNKPSAPVYIRDLIRGLRDSENYDRHKLAIYTASDLIRRKANFGTEVTEHAEELASQLTGLKDSFNLERFEEKRLQAMISLIVAKPLPMGRWFSTMLFNGDYSMSQRASMLTALSMAARDLAGYREQDADLTGAHTDPKDLFPSQRLPPKMDKAFALTASPINALADRAERNMIKPMAATAADKVTGPDILKVRTFSSRMEVEKKRKRPITNELAKVVAEGFFFPLTGRFRTHMQVYGDRSTFAMPFLLAHFLKTLALIMAASGASTLSLPALTTEFWGFLLPLRSEAEKALPVREAILFCFLTVLEINEGDQRQVAEDHAQELLETQSWAQKVFDNARGGEKEGEKVRMLAASVMVKCSDVVEKYQQLLMGAWVNY